MRWYQRRRSQKDGDERAEEASVRGDHRVLLAVDDQALAVEIRRAIGEALPAAQVATAIDRESFAAAVRDWQPALVVCAVRLAGFDAFEALALLRHWGQTLPVVVVSDAVGEEMAVGYLKAGAADFVSRDNIHRFGDAVLAILDRQAVESSPIASAPPEVQPSSHDDLGLDESARLFRHIFEINPVALLVVDPDNEVVLDASRAAGELYGLPLDRIVGASYFKLTGDVDRGLEPALYGVADGTRVVTPADHRHADGTLLDLEITATPLDYQGARAMLCALRRVDKARGGPELPLPSAVATDFVRGFIDEVGSLLNHMRGYADELMVQIAGLHGDPVGARELGDHIGRGDLLLRQLRVLEGHDVAVPEVFDLNEIISVGDVLLSPVLRPDIELVLEPGKGDLNLFADRSQVEMALACLVSSSANAMLDGGRVIIRAGALSADLAWFAVEDEGAPLHQDSLPLLFEPFQDPSLLGRKTGLELAACKRVIDELGGQIEVTCGDYRGMSVLVILPRAAQSC